MSLPKVYADFNAIEYLNEEHSIANLPLTGYGTLASLAKQGLRLRQGMQLLVYEPGDVECEAIVHFDISRRNPSGSAGEWVARIDHAQIRASKEITETGLNFPCIACGTFFSYGLFSARNYTEVCTGCGASVMEPLAPPRSTAS